MKNSDIFIWMDNSVCSIRQKDVRAYCTWVEERLVPSFGSLDEELERAGTSYLAGVEKFFNPDTDDPGEFYERAHDHAIDHCLILAEVNSYMMGMAISGLYHLWEKQVLEHIEREIRHYTENYKLPTKWDEICKCFDEFSTDLYRLPFSACLEELRLVTNVVKHGAGKSLQWLIASESSILDEIYKAHDIPATGGKYSMLRAPIYPRIEHFLKYKEAVLLFWDYEFWREHGERLCYAG